MSVDSILKRESIEITRKLDDSEVKEIAENISEKITTFFSEFLLNHENLTSLLSEIDMYLAKMPTDSAGAKYLYINNSIYFNEEIDFSVSVNSIFALHECIHFLQMKKNNRGKLTRLGLYNLGNVGVAINEAAVQLMASTAQGSPKDLCKYYDIYLNTISPDCYPLQCALLSEMLYFTGTHTLYQSTLNSDDTFKNEFISYSDKKTYDKIESNLDKLLKLEDDVYYFSMQLSNAVKQKDIDSLDRLITNRKNAIRNVFFNTQNLIIQNCFTHNFNNINTLEDVSNFETDLNNFNDVLCYSDDYTFFNDFYYNTMMALSTVKEVIETTGDIAGYRASNKSLVSVDNSIGIVKIFKKIMQKLKRLFSFGKKDTIEINM